MWRWVCASQIDVGSPRRRQPASRFSSADGIGGPQNPTTPLRLADDVVHRRQPGRWRICLAYQSRRSSSMSAPDLRAVAGDIGQGHRESDA